MPFHTVRLAAILALALLVAPLAADAQQPAKAPRIGLLMAHPAGTPPYLEAFYQGLRDLGYIEGQNLVIERRYAEGDDARLPALATELVQLQVKVLVASGPSPTRAAHDATKTIPIVMGNHDPV